MKNWYRFRSKDNKVRGQVKAENEQEVARVAGYPVEELIIEPASVNGGIIKLRKGNARRG